MIFILHSRSLGGFNKFKCTGTEKFGEKTRIILFLAGSVPFKMAPNYSTTLVDADHIEVSGCIVNLFPPNKLLFLAFFSPKHALLSHSSKPRPAHVRRCLQGVTLDEDQWNCKSNPSVSQLGLEPQRTDVPHAHLLRGLTCVALSFSYVVSLSDTFKIPLSCSVSSLSLSLSHTHTHTHTHTHSYTQTQSHTHIHRHIHTQTPHTHKLTHSDTHTHIHGHIHTPHTCTHSHMLIHAHTHIHRHTHTHIYTTHTYTAHTHTHTHTHTCSYMLTLIHTHTHTHTHTLTQWVKLPQL